MFPDLIHTSNLGILTIALAGETEGESWYGIHNILQSIYWFVLMLL